MLIHNSIDPREHPLQVKFGENCKRNPGKTPYYEKIVRILTLNKFYSVNHRLLRVIVNLLTFTIIILRDNTCSDL